MSLPAAAEWREKTERCEQPRPRQRGKLPVAAKKFPLCMERSIRTLGSIVTLKAGADEERVVPFLLPASPDVSRDVRDNTAAPCAAARHSLSR
jgi:hypothetical protein